MCCPRTTITSKCLFPLPGCIGTDKHTERPAPQAGRSVCFRLSKKSLDFFDSLQKCRYFRAAQRRKSPRSAPRKPCTARLPGHSIPREAGGCPLALPRPDTGGFCSTEFFRHVLKKGTPAGSLLSSPFSGRKGPLIRRMAGRMAVSGEYGGRKLCICTRVDTDKAKFQNHGAFWVNI